MGKIVRPVTDFAPILKDIQGRLARLERTDQTGFTRIMSQPAGSQHQQVNQNITTQTYTAVSGSGLTFTLDTQSTVLVVASAAAVNSNASSGMYGYLTIFVDGVNYGYRPIGQGQGLASVALFDSAITGYTNASLYLSIVLAAGAHIIDLRGYTDTAGTNFRVAWTDTYCFVIGA